MSNWDFINHQNIQGLKYGMKVKTDNYSCYQLEINFFPL